MRRTPMPKTRAPMRRSHIRPKRPTPRRREAPRWTVEDWTAANELLLKRCGGLCEACGGQLAGRMERAHRVKRRDGGDRLCNILALHPECHGWTHANPTEARARGLILRTTDDPASVPVLWQGREWSALADDGSRASLALDAGWRIVS